MGLCLSEGFGNEMRKGVENYTIYECNGFPLWPSGFSLVHALLPAEACLCNYLAGSKSTMNFPLSK